MKLNKKWKKWLIVLLFIIFLPFTLIIFGIFLIFKNSKELYVCWKKENNKKDNLIF